jgi:hypothetical protein
MDYFDPEGVTTLSRSLSHNRNVDTYSPNSEPSTSEDSETALNGGADKPFDFEKVLRYYLKKLVFPQLDYFPSLIFFPDEKKLTSNCESSALALKIYGLWAWVPPPVINQLSAVCSIL